MRAGRVIAIAVLTWVIPAIASAQGGPPMQTDDPGTPGNGNWEVNLAAAVDRRSAERLWEAPLLDVNYGYGDRIQLKFEIPWVTRGTDSDTKTGLGNSLLGVKWRFYESKLGEFGLSIYPQLEFNNPTASAQSGLVDRGVRLLLPLEARKKAGPINFSAEAGYWIAQHGSDQWVAGILAAHQASRRLEVIGELHATADSNGAEHELTLDLGGRYTFTEHLVLLLMAGRSFRHLGSDEPQLIGYAGLQVHFSTRKHGERHVKVPGDGTTGPGPPPDGPP